MKALIAILIMMSSCIVDKSVGPSIVIRNNSDYRLVCRSSEYFPDTSAKPSQYTKCREIMPQANCEMSSGVIGKSWKDLFEENVSGKYMFFIFDKDTVESYSEDVVFKDESRVLKKYILTFDSLEKMNYTITYP